MNVQAGFLIFTDSPHFLPRILQLILLFNSLTLFNPPFFNPIYSSPSRCVGLVICLTAVVLSLPASHSTLPLHSLTSRLGGGTSAGGSWSICDAYHLNEYTQLLCILSIKLYALPCYKSNQNFRNRT